MTLNLTINDLNINPPAEPLPNEKFRERKAARAVVINHKGMIVLLNVRNHNYHKLPGGGVEESEDLIMALERELLEETGCTATIIREIGKIVEYRNQEQLHQISYCYIVEQTGEQTKPNFTQSELDEGFEIVWAENIQTAINLLEQDRPNNYDGSFIQLRDLAFLRAAKELV